MRCSTWLLLAVMALAVLAYVPIRQAGLVYEDHPDDPIAVDHVWHGWRVETRGLAHLPPTPRALPSFLSRVVEHVGWNDHLISLIVHFVNTCLVSLLLAPFGVVPLLVGAVIWAGHPLQVESVAYLSARPDLLMGTGLLIALLGAQSGRWGGIVLVLVGAWIAIAAKESGICVLGVVPVYRWWVTRVQRAHPWPRALVVSLSAIGLWGAWHLAWRLLPRLSTWVAPSPYAPLAYAARQAAAVWGLAWLTLVPVGLTVDHDWEALPPWLTAIAALALVLVVLLALAAAPTRPSLVMVVGLILIPLLPRFVIPLPDFLTEHHWHASMIGACVGAAHLTERLSA